MDFYNNYKIAWVSEINFIKNGAFLRTKRDIELYDIEYMVLSSRG